MPDAATIRRYAADPLAFIRDLTIPSAFGPAVFSTVMADFQRERFQALAPALLAVARGQKPAIGRFWLEATKGASKDSDLAAALLWLLSFSQKPLTVQIGAADADQAKELRKAAKLILNLNGWLSDRVSVQNWKLLCEATGSDAEIISCDVAGSHGARPDVLILNELHAIQKWEFAQNLLDNATKVPGGIVVIATNAGMIDHASYKWREAARTSPRWSFHQFAQPAPWLDPAELLDAERRNPRERYRRLFWGEWSHGSGDALSPADLAAAVVAHGPHIERAAVAYVGGLDLGLRRDRSGFCVLAVDPINDSVEVAHLQSWSPRETGREVDLDQVQAHVLQTCRRLKVDSVAYDEWQASFLAQGLQARGVRMFAMMTGAATQQAMAVALIEAFKDRRIRLYDHPELLRDLGRLSIVEKAGGQFRIVAPRDDSGHCDLAQALCLALPTALSWLQEIPATAPLPMAPSYVFA